ncbi:glycosyl transferase, family 8 domain protein [Streptococcus pneumoniae 2070335]|nr:glycosyl transferase, family 8 domain protein [Streptococcus pneumoniae 2070335]
MKEEKKAIVLGADNAYMDKVETTIKSLCVHHYNLKFYVLMMTFRENGSN